MSEMDEKVLDEAMESSTEENASETKEDENVTSTEETAETAENADAEASEADSEDPDKKKSFFKKKKDKKDEQIEELTDKVKRQMAEFDNFRKRTEKEKSQMFDMGAKTIVEKVLPVIDNFERGLKSIPEDQSKYLAEEMMDCAQISSALDERMQKVRDVIMQAEEKEEEKSSGVEPLMLRGLTERIRQKNL